jgi:hypothetical protein
MIKNIYQIILIPGGTCNIVSTSQDIKIIYLFLALAVFVSAVAVAVAVA